MRHPRAARLLLLLLLHGLGCNRRSADPPPGMRVAFAAPGEGATVPHVVAVAADVIGGHDPITVTFSADRAPSAQVSEPPFLANLDLSANPAGRIQLVATAVDGLGRVARAHRQVVVDRGLLAQDALPRAALVAPSSRLLCGRVEVVAEGSDDHGLASLTLYLDGMEVTTGAQSPLRWSWNTPGSGDGDHVLKVLVRDDKGQLASAVLAVAVDNARGVCDQPPTVTVTAPEPARPLRGVVEISAAAQDDVAVVKVELSVDDRALLVDDSAPYQASWDSRRVADGPHTLQAVATDSAGLTGQARREVIVDNTAPAIAFVSPVDGNRVSGMVTVTIDARDPGGLVSVVLRDRGPDGAERELGARATAPFAFAWDTGQIAGGPHRLTAVARDRAGNEASASADLIVGAERGTTCGVDRDCASGFCSDGVCCASRCDEPCRTCATPGQAGQCLALTSGVDAPTCAGLHACGAGGACLKVQGQPCAAASECLLGFCADGVCCTSACDGACLTCKKPGDEGRCQTAPVGPDPGTCEGALTCDNLGACKKAQGQSCQAASECSSGACQQDRCCPDQGCGPLSPAPAYAGTVDLPARVKAIAAAPGGRVVVVGTIWYATDFDPGPGSAILDPGASDRFDAYVAVYRPDLSLEWVRAIGGAGRSTPGGVGVGPDGGIVVAGMFQGALDLDPGPGVIAVNKPGDINEYAMWWVKLSASGDHVWSRTLMPPRYAWVDSFAMAPDGTTAIGGNATTSISFEGAGAPGPTFPIGSDSREIVAVADYDGNLRHLTVTDLHFLSLQVALAADGSVVYGGSFQGDIDARPGPGVDMIFNRGVSDSFLTRLDRDGKYLWSRQIGGPDLDSGATPFISPDGSLYVIGDFGLDIVFDPSDPQRPIPQGGYDAYVMKLGLDNSYRWTRILTGAGYFQWLAFLPDGNLLLTGAHQGPVDLDAGPGQLLLGKSSPLGSDTFVASWSPEGLFRWAVALGGQGNTTGISAVTRVVSRDDGLIILGGSAEGAADFDPGPGVDTHGTDGFLTRLRPQ